MMKDFFKKLNKNQSEVDDLDTGYDSEYYQGAYDRSAEKPAEKPVERPVEPPVDRQTGYNEPPVARRYEEPVRGDIRVDRAEGYDENFERYERIQRTEPAAPAAPSRTWQESDAPAYRERPEEKAEAVFTPAPAPEYLYFTPSTYRDCREAIVRGLSAGHVVVVRLGGLEAGDVLRLFDYMMGAVLALEGELARPRATTVVLLPHGIELDEDALELDDEEEDENDEDLDEAYEDDEYEDDEAYEDEDDEYAEDDYHDGEYGGYDYDEEDEESDDAEVDDDEYDEDDYVYETDDAEEDVSRDAE